MNPSIRSAALAALAALATTPLVVAPASAQAPTPGERWRTTMSMEMMGMKMPGRTSEVCSPRNATQAPMQPEQNCQITNRKRVGTTESFDMVCTGKEGMSGHMEMTQESPTRWRGTMLAKTAQGEMTMNYASEKLPGDCDASAMERKVNALVAQGEDQRRQMCMEGARSMAANQFLGTPAACTDAASRKAYCDNARTMRGFNSVSGTQRLASVYKGAQGDQYRSVLADTGKLCGFEPETVRTQLCSTAQGKKEWKFLAEECAEISQPLAQRECAGRDFTTPVAPPYVAFCSAYAAAGRGVSGPRPASAGDGNAVSSPAASGSASATAQGGPADAAAGQPAEAGQPASTSDKAKDAVKKGKDALKGLFGR